MRALPTLTRGLRVALALFASLTLFAPNQAEASSPKRPAAKAASDDGGRYDPDDVTAISRFRETIAKATEHWVSKDHTAAIDTFKKAIELGPRDPLGHYMLAEAYLGSGNPGEADAAIQRALELSSARAPLLQARILFLRAEVLERQKKWEDAKTAWQAYAEHSKNVAGTFPQTAAERIKAIQRALDLDRAYAVVRERIAAEKQGAPK